MPRNTPPAYDLSDAELRDLTELIRNKQPLPEKYRFVLFADKREVELVWNGKTRDVCTTVMLFQTLEHVDEPRAETKTQGQLFDARGRQTQGWTNKLIWGDNKLILSSLKSGALRRQIEDAGGRPRSRTREACATIGSVRHERACAKAILRQGRVATGVAPARRAGAVSVNVRSGVTPSR